MTGTVFEQTFAGMRRSVVMVGRANKAEQSAHCQG